MRPGVELLSEELGSGAPVEKHLFYRLSYRMHYAIPMRIVIRAVAVFLIALPYGSALAADILLTMRSYGSVHTGMTVDEAYLNLRKNKGGRAR